MPTLMTLAAREVLDSRGRPTVEVEATTSAGESGRAIVPSGASTGKHEALELRDGDPARYAGLGVLKAVENVRTEIAGAIVGMPVEDQPAIDAALIALDGTPNKSRLGANAILGASLAAAHAAAATRGRPLYEHLHRLWRDRFGEGDPGGPSLPMPMVNMISGGLHAGHNLDFQDFLLIPVGASSYGEALRMAVDVHRALGRTLAKYGHESSLVADEGGYGPRLRTNAHAVELILEAALSAGFTPGKDVAIALDAAATHFYDVPSATYRLASDGLPPQDSSAMLAMLAHWVRQYPIVSIEDGLAEDDWNGWAALTRRIGRDVQLVGDDLFATQPRRIERGVAKHAANAVLIKLNQVGTLTETLDALALARRSGYRAVVSARSGETEDATIADLAVATGAGQIKIGSVTRSERLAKYNRLLRIEERLGPDAPFAGRAALGLS
ncbi:MAG TPA: phosphopyruvate hydratase [Isosphaeraceae bacterium]